MSVDNQDSLPSPDILTQIKTLINAAYASATSDPQQCLNLSKEALELSQAASFDLGIGVALMHIGIARYYSEEFDDAMFHYEKALSILIPLNAKGFVGNIYNNMGLIYSRWNNLYEELRCYQEALKFIDSNQDMEYYLFAMNNLAGVYSSLARHAEALEIYRNLFPLARKNHLDTAMVKIAQNKAQEYMTLGKHPMAKKWLLKAKELCIKVQDKATLILIYCTLAEIAGLHGNFTEAYIALLEAQSLAKFHASANMQVIVLQHFALYFRQTNSPEEERKYLRQALTIAEKHRLNNQLISIYPRLIEMYKATKKPALALALLEKLILIQREEDSHKAQMTISELTFKNKIEQQELENKAIRHELIRKERQTRIIKAQKAQLLQIQKKLQDQNLNLEKIVEEHVKQAQKQSERLHQKSKLEFLGKMASGIAHEVYQPLSAISLSTTNLAKTLSRKGVNSSVFQDKISRIERNIDRISSVINQVRSFSKPLANIPLTCFPPEKAIQSSLELMKPLLETNKVKYRLQISTHASCQAYLQKLEQIFVNIMKNAIDAMQETPIKDRYIHINLHEEQDRICVSLRDHGMGIEAENLQRIFEPFYSSKVSGESIGLGLWICYTLLQEIGGEISVKSQPGNGATILIYLPICTEDLLDA